MFQELGSKGWLRIWERHDVSGFGKDTTFEDLRSTGWLRIWE